MTAPTKVTVKIRHEEFCQPTGGRGEIRIESYVAYADDLKTGRSYPTHDVTRCLECGAAYYKQRS